MRDAIRECKSKSRDTTPSHPASRSPRRIPVTRLVLPQRTKSASLTWLTNCDLHDSMPPGTFNLSAGGDVRCKTSLSGVGVGVEMTEGASLRGAARVIAALSSIKSIDQFLGSESELLPHAPLAGSLSDEMLPLAAVLGEPPLRLIQLGEFVIVERELYQVLLYAL